MFSLFGMRMSWTAQLWKGSCSLFIFREDSSTWRASIPWSNQPAIRNVFINRVSNASNLYPCSLGMAPNLQFGFRPFNQTIHLTLRAMVYQHSTKPRSVRWSTRDMARDTRLGHRSRCCLCFEGRCLPIGHDPPSTARQKWCWARNETGEELRLTQNILPSNVQYWSLCLLQYFSRCVDRRWVLYAGRHSIPTAQLQGSTVTFCRLFVEQILQSHVHCDQKSEPLAEKSLSKNVWSLAAMTFV